MGEKTKDKRKEHITIKLIFISLILIIVTITYQNCSKVGVPLKKSLSLVTEPSSTDPFSANNEFLDLPLDQLKNLTHEVVVKYCTTCHGTNLREPDGGFGFVDDLDRLANTLKYITPGDASASPLIIDIINDIMPEGAKYGSTPPVPTRGKKILVAWVQNLRSKDEVRPFIDEKSIANLIANDLRGQPFDKRRNFRYLTLTHYYNNKVSQSKFHVFVSGLTKLINSLSWNEQGHVPQTIGNKKTILRINLNDLKWSPQIWDDLIKIYPYDLSTPDLPFNSFEELSGTRLPYLRGDWFAFEVSKPPLYHSILELPRTESELETTSGTVRKLLNINVKANIDNNLVARSGFQKSGVSANNRLIERHPSPFGAYWKSYDFQKDSGDKSRILFFTPLGPYERDGFKHDGGEIIFNLPNGLQAYFLSDSNGNRLDIAPLEIVQDETRSDRIVHNGISCISCHANGIRRKNDELRSYFLNLNNFPGTLIQDVIDLHPVISIFNKLIDKDIKTFHDAQRRLGLDPTLKDEKDFEPISSLVYDFEAPLKFDRIAIELGISSNTFKSLLDQSDQLKALALRGRSGGVPREEFTTLFEELVQTVKDVQFSP